MKTLIKLLFTAIAVVVLAKIMPGVHVAGYGTAIIVALVLALLRFTVKPLLILFTLPLTLLTFGLFILVINAIIISLADYFISGFSVDSFWTALFFSILLAVFESILFSLIKED